MSLRKAILGAAVIFGLMGLWANPSLGPAWAQNVQCANQTAGNSTNACANTRFVSSAITAICSATPSFCQTLLGYTYTGWYGAVCNGSTDDTTAITNAIAATTAGGVLYVQNGRCLVSGSGSQIFLISTKVIKIRGYGMTVLATGATGTTFYISSAVPTSRDLFRITGTTGNNLRGYEFSEFNVVPQSGTVGRHVFHFDSTAGAATNFSEVMISRVYASGSASAGGYSVFLNNTGGATVQGGFYNSDITQSWLGGGIGSVLTGDSIRVTNNILSTANCGVLVDQVAGAGGFAIQYNNVSGTAGGVCAGGATGLIIDSNIFEQQVTSTEPNNSIIDLIGSSRTIANAKITKNQIQSNAAIGNPTLIRVATASNTSIENNYLGVPAAYAGMVITAAATNTIIGNANYCPTCSTLATDSGTGTVMTPKTGYTTLINGVYYNASGGAAGNSITTTAAMTDGQLLVGATSAAPAPRTMSGDCTITTLAAITCTKSNGVDLRPIFSANTTYYVRTDGNDSNTCLVDSAGGACLTIQGALNKRAAADGKTFTTTIQVQDGTYAGAATCAGPWLGGGSVTIQGNSGTPSNVVVTNTGATAISATAGCAIIVKDLKVTDALFGILASTTGSISFGNMVFTTLTQAVRASDNGAITCLSNYTIDGSQTNHWVATAGGVLRCQSLTLTLTGTPAFASAFMSISIGGVAVINGMTYSGSATGPKARISDNGIAYAVGSASTVFPGSTNPFITGGGILVATQVPAVSACGTTPAIVGTDLAGEVTMGTATPTGCTITFATQYATAPWCTVSWQANLASMTYTISTTVLTLTQTATSSNKVNWTCYAT